MTIKKLRVAVIVIASLLMSPIVLTACSSSQAPTQNKTKTKAITSKNDMDDFNEKYGICRIGSFAIRYPPEWEVEDAPSGKFIRPSYGGLVYVASDPYEKPITEDNRRIAFDEFIKGLESNDDASYDCLENTIKEADFDGLYAYTCDFAMIYDGTSYKGALLLAMKDYANYGVLISLPQSSYEEHKSDIERIFNSASYQPEPDELDLSDANETEIENSDDTTKDEESDDSNELDEPDESGKSGEPDESYSQQKTLFEFGDGNVNWNSMYVVYDGSITNVSNTTYRFIKVKGTFLDKDGNAIDTDTAYACGDEGLAPGETTKFRLSVDRDERITKVSFQIYDYRL